MRKVFPTAAKLARYLLSEAYGIDDEIENHLYEILHGDKSYKASRQYFNDISNHIFLTYDDKKSKIFISNEFWLVESTFDYNNPQIEITSDYDETNNPW